MQHTPAASHGNRPVKTAMAVAIAPCVVLIAAGVARSTPWGLDLWLLLQVVVFAVVAIGVKVGSRKIALASGASAVIAGWSVLRILSGLLVISVLLGLVRLIPSFTEGGVAWGEMSVRPDRYAMILEGIWIIWCLFGAAVVVEQDEAIREKERPVVAAKAQDRREARRIDRARTIVEAISVDTPEQRLHLDRIAQDLQTVELALAHSMGGGLGTIENPRSSEATSRDAARIDTLVGEVEAAGERLKSSTSVDDPQLESLAQLVKELLDVAERQEDF